MGGPSSGSLDVPAEAASFLERDFNQCFDQMRHYDGQVLDICKFVMGTYTALTGLAVGAYEFSKEKNLNLLPAACIALLVGLLVGLLLLIMVVRNRASFVLVARYVNEHRQLFLRHKPLGFQNRTGMYTDPSKPPFFDWASSQLWVAYVIAGLNSTLLGVVVFLGIQSGTCRTLSLVVGPTLLLFSQILVTILYLRSREGKTAERAMFRVGQ